mmetsp:Transcript_53648/g.164986  ORF Transcript_53648/g.164986 Transcript_53648/m.164986 type:complete len:1069 (-) Transcript_53648:78-3284(-)
MISRCSSTATCRSKSLFVWRLSLRPSSSRRVDDVGADANTVVVTALVEEVLRRDPRAAALGDVRAVGARARARERDEVGVADVAAHLVERVRVRVEREVVDAVDDRTARGHAEGAVHVRRARRVEGHRLDVVAVRDGARERAVVATADEHDALGGGLRRLDVLDEVVQVRHLRLDVAAHPPLEEARAFDPLALLRHRPSGDERRERGSRVERKPLAVGVDGAHHADATRLRGDGNEMVLGDVLVEVDPAEAVARDVVGVAARDLVRVPLHGREVEEEGLERRTGGAAVGVRGEVQVAQLAHAEGGRAARARDVRRDEVELLLRVLGVPLEVAEPRHRLIDLRGRVAAGREARADERRLVAAGTEADGHEDPQQHPLPEQQALVADEGEVLVTVLLLEGAHLGRLLAEDAVDVAHIGAAEAGHERVLAQAQVRVERVAVAAHVDGGAEALFDLVRQQLVRPLAQHEAVRGEQQEEEDADVRRVAAEPRAEDADEHREADEDDRDDGAVADLEAAAGLGEQDEAHEREHGDDEPPRRPVRRRLVEGEGDGDDDGGGETDDKGRDHPAHGARVETEFLERVLRVEGRDLVEAAAVHVDGVRLALLLALLLLAVAVVAVAALAMLLLFLLALAALSGSRLVLVAVALALRLGLGLGRGVGFVVARGLVLVAALVVAGALDLLVFLAVCGGLEAEGVHPQDGVHDEHQDEGDHDADVQEELHEVRAGALRREGQDHRPQHRQHGERQDKHNGDHVRRLRAAHRDAHQREVCRLRRPDLADDRRLAVDHCGEEERQSEEHHEVAERLPRDVSVLLRRGDDAEEHGKLEVEAVEEGDDPRRDEELARPQLEREREVRLHDDVDDPEPARLRRLCVHRLRRADTIGSLIVVVRAGGDGTLVAFVLLAALALLAVRVLLRRLRRGGGTDGRGHAITRGDEVAVGVVGGLAGIVLLVVLGLGVELVAERVAGGGVVLHLPTGLAAGAVLRRVVVLGAVGHDLHPRVVGQVVAVDRNGARVAFGRRAARRRRLRSGLGGHVCWLRRGGGARKGTLVSPGCSPRKRRCCVQWLGGKVAHN